VRKSDIERIVDIERSWFHLSHWSIDSYYRLLSDDGFTTSFVAESEDEETRLTIAGFVIFHVAAGGYSPRQSRSRRTARRRGWCWRCGNPIREPSSSTMNFIFMSLASAKT